MGFTKDDYYQETFIKITLSKETIKEVEFEECGFAECSFVNCKFIKCRFINCKFDSCVISAVIPTGCHFVDARFTGSKVIGVDWTKAQRIQEISFEKCQINYSNFRFLKLPKITMVNCEAKEVDFTETDLTEGNFADTDFEKSIFLKTILTEANLGGAKNYYIDARYNTIKKAHFSLPEALFLLDSLDVIID